MNAIRQGEVFGSYDNGQSDVATGSKVQSMH